MDKQTDIISTLQEYIFTLSSKIGPRPAGSPAELEAFNFIRSKMTAFGYTLKESQVPFPTPAAVDFVYPAAGLIILIACLVMKEAFWAGLLLPIFGMSVPQIYQAYVYNRKPDSETINLLAKLPAEDSKDTQNKAVLIFTAHVDSGKASPFSNPFWLWLENRTLDLMQRTAIFAAIVSAFAVIGFPIPNILYDLVITAAGLTFSWLLISAAAHAFAPEQYSPGANDNASGLAALLHIAEQTGLYPPSRLDVQFLFTGAEETGLNGARAFARSLTKEDWPLGVIVLDSIGSGQQLSAAVRDGTLIRRRTSAKLNNMIRTVSPETGSYWFTHKSADHLPFLVEGIPAAALISRGYGAVGDKDHTLQDTLSTIQFTALEAHTKMLIRLIEYINSSPAAFKTHH